MKRSSTTSGVVYGWVPPPGARRRNAGHLRTLGRVAGGKVTKRGGNGRGGLNQKKNKRRHFKSVWLFRVTCLGGRPGDVKVPRAQEV